MKKSTRSIIGVILIMTVMFLIASFIAWDTNPDNWNAGGRFMTCFASVILSVLYVVDVYDKY